MYTKMSHTKYHIRKHDVCDKNVSQFYVMKYVMKNTIKYVTNKFHIKCLNVGELVRNEMSDIKIHHMYFFNITGKYIPVYDSDVPYYYNC